MATDIRDGGPPGGRVCLWGKPGSCLRLFDALVPCGDLGKRQKKGASLHEAPRCFAFLSAVSQCLRR